MKKNLVYEPVSDTMYMFPEGVMEVRGMLMYYVNCYTFFESPEKDRAKILEDARGQPPEPSLFD